MNRYKLISKIYSFYYKFFLKKNQKYFYLINRFKYKILLNGFTYYNDQSYLIKKIIEKLFQKSKKF